MLYVEHFLYRADKKEAGKQKRSVGQNLVRRFQEHRSGVIRLLDDFSVPFTNNQTEQDISIMKVKMNISGFRTLARCGELCLDTKHHIVIPPNKGSIHLQHFTSLSSLFKEGAE